MENESFEQQVTQAQARVRQLTIERDKLHAPIEAQRTEMALLEALHLQEKKLEREIAELEGRPYRDEDDPDDNPDYPEPPEPPAGR